jgi:uncharacterized membrane protein YccC
MSFLFGALFVSLTDTPGPIHHRRNGMLVGSLLNTGMVLLIGVSQGHEWILVVEVLFFSLLLSLLGIYGSRAGAIGTLALVIMLISMSPLRRHQPILQNAILTLGGGLWYTLFSLMLYRLQPYRLIEQALGESLMQVADYIRARAAFYKKSSDLAVSFNHVMKEQSDVVKAQAQMRELLFKTRQFVGDASPKSRTMMLIFLESLDLFEETMHAYQDYHVLQEEVDDNLLHKLYSIILKVADEFDYVALQIQGGMPVRKVPSFNHALQDWNQALQQTRNEMTMQNFSALEQTSQNIQMIITRLNNIILYTRMETDVTNRTIDGGLEISPTREPLTISLLIENLTVRSSNFRYALRISISLMIGYGISAMFALSHSYWVMLTILTILKPVYNLTRIRNVQRVVGTLGGVLIANGILYLVSNQTALVIIMVTCMLFAYSLLRMNYLGFVIFLTTYIIITFHFLNPVEFKSLIGERLIDTLIGSVIAGMAARFIFPVWQQHSIQSAMQRTMMANRAYFDAAWKMLQLPSQYRKQYNTARNEAIVALTNLSDSFQQMLSEPGKLKYHSAVHQLVIASHTFISRVAALSPKEIKQDEATGYADKILTALQVDDTNRLSKVETEFTTKEVALQIRPPSMHPLSVISSLAMDMKRIVTSITDDE